VWTGTIRITVQEWGIVLWSDACSTDVTIPIDHEDDPPIAFDVECTLAGDVPGTFTATLGGSFPADPAVEGDVLVDHPHLPEPQVGTWSGAFTADDRLEGAFDGLWASGEAGFSWDATFEATR